jgi:predicted DNA-binding ribbon-helix-helix protein
MQSAIVKRSVVIGGHKTSVSLEDDFWHSLKDIGKGQHKTLSNLVADINTNRLHGNLSSAIRLFVLEHFRSQTGLGSNERPGIAIGNPLIKQVGHQPQLTNGRSNEIE